jgi:hypothetical protein
MLVLLLRKQRLESSEIKHSTQLLSHIQLIVRRIHLVLLASHAPTVSLGII